MLFNMQMLYVCKFINTYSQNVEKLIKIDNLYIHVFLYRILVISVRLFLYIWLIFSKSSL